jgi:transporter family-2 protein
MKLGWLCMALMISLIIPAQAAMNAKMREFVLNPMYSSMINFSVGAVAGIVLTAISLWLGQSSHWRGAAQAPWWAWCGGLVGMGFVTIAVLAVPRLGSATFTVTVIAGQLLGALALDHFGLLGLPQHTVSSSRLGGALLLLAGVWLMQRT